MALKAVVGSLDEVPEAFRSLYAEDADSGQFALQVDGAAPVTKLKEFRDTNVALKRQVEQLQDQLKRFDGLAPEEIATLRTQIAELQDKAKLASGDFEGAVEQRLKRTREEFERKAAEQARALQTLQDERKGLVERLQFSELSAIFTAAADKAGVRQDAVDDVISRAQRVWRWEDDKLVARDKNGEVMYDNTAKEMTPESWVKTLADEKPYYFKASAGGGASGGSTGGRGPLTITKEQARTPSPELLEAIASGKVTVVG